MPAMKQPRHGRVSVLVIFITFDTLQVTTQSYYVKFVCFRHVFILRS